MPWTHALLLAASLGAAAATPPQGAAPEARLALPDASPSFGDLIELTLTVRAPEGRGAPPSAPRAHARSG